MLKAFNIAALQHPKTTAGGVLAALAGVALLVFEVRKAILGETVTEEAMALIVALFAGAWSALWAKDGDKSNAPTAAPTKAVTGLVLLLALGLAAPSFALAQDPTAGTVDGATVAARVAEEASPFRWSLELPLPGRPLLVPAVAIAPLAVDLKAAFAGEMVFARAFNVGGGADVLWRASSRDPVGFAVHGLMRATDGGPRAMGALLAIVPFLSRAGLRPGVAYQLGGHALFLLEGATSFGASPSSGSP